MARRSGGAVLAAAIVAGLLPVIGLTAAAPAYAAAPGPSPSTATNTGTATVHFTGNDYSLNIGGETVTITRHGTTETITGTTPNPDSSTSSDLVRNFDLTAAAPGAYDVSVSPGSPGLPGTAADTCSSCFSVTGGTPTVSEVNNNSAVTASSVDKTVAVQGTNLAKAATLTVNKLGAADPDVTATVASVTSLTLAHIKLHFPNGNQAESGQRTLAWTNTNGKSATCTCLSITGQIPGTAPAPPTQVKAFPGNHSADVVWKIGSDGGNVLTGFTVFAHPGSAKAQVGPTATSATVGQLTNGTSYTFTVVAKNQRGSSTPSVASGPVTPHAPRVTVDLPTVVTPGASPTEFSLTLTNSTVTAYPKARIDFTVTGLPALDTSRVSLADVNSGVPAPVTLHNARGSVTGRLPNTGTFALGAGTTRTIPFTIRLDKAAPSGTLIVVATIVDASTPSSPVAVATDSDNARVVGKTTRFVPVRPLRFVDSRNGVGIRKGPHTGTTVITIPQTVPNDARAAVLEIGVIAPTRTGSLQVYPTGGRASDRALSFHAKQAQVQMTVVRFSTGHQVSLRLSGGSAQFTVDLLGYQTDNGVDGGRYLGLAPTRIADTRGHAQPQKRTVTVRVPASVPLNAAAVLLTVTAVNAHQVGTVKVFAQGATVPAAVAVDFVKGLPHSNAYVTKMSSSRRISVLISGRADVVVDIVGYYARGLSYSDRYTPVPVVLFVNAPKSGTFTVGLPASVPADARSVFMTVTAQGPTTAGSLRAYAAGTTSPATFGLVWSAHRGSSNLVASRVGTGSAVTFRVSGGSTHLQIELLGYTTR